MLFTEETHYTIHFYALLAFAFCLPIYPYAASLAMSVATLNWLISGQWSHKWRRIRHPFVGLSVAFYALHLIGMGYTTEQATGWFNLETKLSFLFIPLVVFGGIALRRECRNQLLLGFLSGVIASAVVAFMLALTNLPAEGVEALFYTNLSQTIGQHPTYMALYVSFAFMALLYFFIKNGQRFKKGMRIAMMGVMLFLYIMIFMLSSRIMMLGITFVFCASVILFFLQKKSWGKAIGASLMIVLVNMLLVSMFPTTSKRVSQGVAQGGSQENIRMVIWKKAWSIVEESPFIGVGPADIQPQLNAHYELLELDKPRELELDVHNQYLQTAAGLGIVGLFVLLMMLLLPTIKSLHTQHFLMIVLLSLVAIGLLTESMFERQWGILFFCFFSSLFFWDFVPDDVEETYACKVIPINRGKVES